MSQALVDALVDFHAVDYKALGLEDLGKPDGFIQRQIAGWYRRWEAAKAEEIPEIDHLYAWLKDHRCVSRESTLVHNDFKLDNIMLDSSDPGRVVAEPGIRPVAVLRRAAGRHVARESHR